MHPGQRPQGILEFQRLRRTTQLDRPFEEAHIGVNHNGRSEAVDIEDQIRLCSPTR
jgi:hypothetical protein